jgi:hypothetical protein
MRRQCGKRWMAWTSILVASRPISTFTIYSDGIGRWPKLTEVFWDCDSGKVGILVCDALAGNIVFAYDPPQRRPSQQKQ